MMVKQIGRKGGRKGGKKEGGKEGRVTRYLKKIKTSSGGTGNGQPLSSTE
jgi:hypothetical protein